MTVAVVGDPGRVWAGGLRYPDDWQVPYDQREKLTFEVEETDALGAVLRRALQALDVPGPPSPGGGAFDPAFIGFYSAHRQDDFGRLQPEVTLLDERNRVRWTGRWLDEPMSEFLRAGDAGVLDGDPRRPYLILQPGIGNGVLVDWQTLVELWKLWWDVADKAAILGGLWALWEGASRRLKNRQGPTPPESPEIVSGLYANWQANGGRPDNFLHFLGQRPWPLDDLAEALGCTREQAEALLIGFGHERNSAGLWVPGTSEAARLIRDNAEFVIQAGMTTRLDAVEDTLRNRAKRFQRTGEAPPLDWTKIGDLPPDLSRLSSDETPPTTLSERLSVVFRYRAASALHRIRRKLSR